MKILKSYILKEHISPFFISMMVVTFVMLIDRIIDLLNLIIEKKLPMQTVVEVFALSLPYILALSIPMAVLVATILAFGRMSVDREIIAIKSSGVNVYRMLGPLLATAILLCGLMVYFNHWFLPDTNHKLKNLMLKIAYYKPMTIIKENEFTNFMDYTIFAKGNNDSLLTDVLIYDRSQSRFPRTVFATTGNVTQMDNGNSLQIALNNGEMHERNEKEPGKYQRTKFSRYVINIRNLGNNMDFFETGYRSDREMTVVQLVASLKSNKQELAQKNQEVANLEQRLSVAKMAPQSYSQNVEVRRLQSMQQMAKDRVTELIEIIRSLQVEFHKKFAISFAIIIFVMVGVPLGLMTRTSGIGMAFSVSSVIFLVYYIALNGGEQLADKGGIPPFVAMWISNIVFFILSLFLISASIKEKRLIDMPTLMWKITHLRQHKTPPPDELVH
ncbi:MAG: LptF/LptG family permease [Candidatus Cloacimonas sp.]|jgi:lipopolysaccharide export system permease protein|nr:LptF/LptG family permease [Candidatus Cloacimonas sp.]